MPKRRSSRGGKKAVVIPSYVQVQSSLSLEELKQADLEHQDVVNATCEICNINENDDQCLLCDMCNKAYHTYCLGLPGLPDDEYWFCKQCKKEAAKVQIVPTLSMSNPIGHASNPNSISRSSSNSSHKRTSTPTRSRSSPQVTETPTNYKPIFQLFDVVPIPPTSDFSLPTVPAVLSPSARQQLSAESDTQATQQEPTRFSSTSNVDDEFRRVQELDLPTRPAEDTAAIAQPSGSLAITPIVNMPAIASPERGMGRAADSGFNPFSALLPSSAGSSPLTALGATDVFPAELAGAPSPFSSRGVAVGLTAVSMPNSIARSLIPPVLSQSQSDAYTNAESQAGLNAPRPPSATSEIPSVNVTNSQFTDASLREHRKRPSVSSIQEPDTIKRICVVPDPNVDPEVEFVTLNRIQAVKKELPDPPVQPVKGVELQPSEPSEALEWRPFAVGWPGGLFAYLGPNYSAHLLDVLKSSNISIREYVQQVPAGASMEQSLVRSTSMPPSDPQDSHDDRDASGGSDIEVVDAKTSVEQPLNDWAHFRWMCQAVPFAEQELAIKMQYCPNCRCYICDDLASKCPMWNNHARADRGANWTEERRLVRTYMEHDIAMIKALPQLLFKLRDAALQLYNVPEKTKDYQRVYEEYSALSAFAKKYEQVMTMPMNECRLDFTLGYGKLKLDCLRRAAAKMEGQAQGGRYIQSEALYAKQRCEEVLQSLEAGQLHLLSKSYITSSGEFAPPKTGQIKGPRTRGPLEGFVRRQSSK